MKGMEGSKKLWIFSIISGQTILWKYANVAEHALYLPYKIRVKLACCYSDQF